MQEKDDIKKKVREGYTQIALQKGSCCCGPNVTCCGGDVITEISRKIGYTDKDLTAVPDGANLGLGCGNPLALASIRYGDIVVDLGSGAGFDCFLVAQRVGETGLVIGVDMTPAMIDKARENARKGKVTNIEFRLGEIEHLPVADHTADLVISNCVINLSPDKSQVFKEAFRILKLGGRLMISDIVLLKELPEAVQTSVSAYIGCVAGAVLKKEYLDTMREAGFHNIQILEETSFPIDFIMSVPIVKDMVMNLSMTSAEASELARSVISMKVSARKPEM